MTQRSAEIAANLAAVDQRIAAACAAAGRPRDAVSLIVVTKTYPAADVACLADLGVKDIGENRHPEAGRKAAEVQRSDITWHFVGALQTNKANAVARYADVIHSVDRARLVTSLNRAAELAERSITALVQVRLSSTEGRAGVLPQDAVSIAEAIAAQPHVRLGGVMGVAPLDEDPRPAFEQLREVSERIIEVEPQAAAISAGMSEDLEQAVQCGATHLRIGRAVLGERPSLQ